MFEVEMFSKSDLNNNYDSDANNTTATMTEDMKSTRGRASAPFFQNFFVGKFLSGSEYVNSSL
jgi:hypothetical protein